MGCNQTKSAADIPVPLDGIDPSLDPDDDGVEGVDNEDKSAVKSSTYLSSGRGTRQRSSVMNAPPKVDESWVPPKYEKTAEEQSSIRQALSTNILFSATVLCAFSDHCHFNSFVRPTSFFCRMRRICRL
jgi:hypothetical protein